MYLTMALCGGNMALNLHESMEELVVQLIICEAALKPLYKVRQISLISCCAIWRR
jgi:hypothetical protein